MNPEQLTAVHHGNGPLMILAGAGVGKTTCVVGRVVHLIEQRGVPPWEILAVTFTNKAAGEMRTRIREQIGAERADEMQIGTFHSICARLLRRYGYAIGLRPNFQILDDSDTLKIIEQILTETGRDESAAARDVITAIDYAKTRGLSIDESQTILDETGEIALDSASLREIHARYQKRLRDEGAVDFNDLLLLTRELIRHPRIGPELRARFAHVLVDEFQDTSAVQYELVRALSDRTKNLTVCGDDDQSLYSWRNAEPRNLLDFPRDYRDVEIVKLERNYRSTPAILEIANRLIRNNRERYAKRLWTEPLPPSLPGDPDGKGHPVTRMVFDDDYGEANYVARAIGRYMATPIPAGAPKRKFSDVAILYRTHAQSRSLEESLRRERIPVRVVGGTSFFERAEVRDVIAYLRVIANPAADSALGRVINRPTRGIGEASVLKLRAWARSESWARAEANAQAAAPRDIWGRAAPVDKPTRGDADELAVAVPVIGLLDAVRAGAANEIDGCSPTARKGMAKLAQLIDSLRDLLEDDVSIAVVISKVIDLSGMRAKLEADGSAESIARLENLSELVSIATRAQDERRFEQESKIKRAAEKLAAGTSFSVDEIEAAEPADASRVRPLSIDEFLERIALVQSEEEAATGDGSAVAMMTIHSAKGLEWPAVFSTGWEDGLLPSLRIRKGPSSTLGEAAERAAIEEERRLAYVAITRARERLTITYARSRRVWGEPRECTPSRFLAEIVDGAERT